MHSLHDSHMLLSQSTRPHCACMYYSTDYFFVFFDSVSSTVAAATAYFACLALRGETSSASALGMWLSGLDLAALPSNSFFDLLAVIFRVSVVPNSTKCNGLPSSSLNESLDSPDIPICAICVFTLTFAGSTASTEAELIRSASRWKCSGIGASDAAAPAVVVRRKGIVSSLFEKDASSEGASPPALLSSSSSAAAVATLSRYREDRVLMLEEGGGSKVIECINMLIKYFEYREDRVLLGGGGKRGY